MLSDAVDQRLLTKNIALLVKVKGKKEKTRIFLSHEETLRLLKESRNDSFIGLVIRILMFLGLRHGEIRGPQWRDMSPDFNKMHLHRKIYREKGGGLKEGPVKTERSERSLTIPESLRPALARAKETHDRNKAALGRAYRREGYVLAWEDGSPIDHDLLTKRFKRFMDELDPPLPSVTPHGLRHTHMTLLGYSDAGKDEDAMMARGGWSDPQMLKRYKHTTPSEEKLAEATDQFYQDHQDVL
jgi:integrase